MDALVGSTPSTGLRPYAFMVAWDGVLTLAYRGFPQPLVDLKCRLARDFPELPPENPGSKWPKTTLGAVADPAKRITLEQLQALKRVCSECSAELQADFSADDAYFPVDALSVLIYCCTSSEKRLITHTMNLLSTDYGRDISISSEEQQRVSDVLGEFDDERLIQYLERVATGRNSAANYRSPRVGSTLVYELPLNRQAHVATLARFRTRVDAALGEGFYLWFEEPALHVTIRGL